MEYDDIQTVLVTREKEDCFECEIKLKLPKNEITSNLSDDDLSKLIYGALSVIFMKAYNGENSVGRGSVQ